MKSQVSVINSPCKKQVHIALNTCLVKLLNFIVVSLKFSCGIGPLQHSSTLCLLGDLCYLLLQPCHTAHRCACLLICLPIVAAQRCACLVICFTYCCSLVICLLAQLDFYVCLMLFLLLQRLLAETVS